MTAPARQCLFTSESVTEGHPAAYGHFGRDDADFTWERTDVAPALRAAAGPRETPDQPEEAAA